MQLRLSFIFLEADMHFFNQLLVLCRKTGVSQGRHLRKISLIAVMSLSLLFPGCFLISDDVNSPAAPFNGNVVITAVASDYSSGAHSMMIYDKPYIASNNIHPTVSDISIDAYGGYFYRIKKYNYDTITKFSFDEPSIPIWQFSTMDGNDTAEGVTSSNPKQLVFASDTKAYLLRLGSKRVWIVNPSATTQADFKTGELDLSAYVDAGDTDGVPEMSAGVITGGKLFIIMQRLTGWPAVRDGYVAVFDVSTDTEIDTDPVNPGLLGIKLSSNIQNPTGITASGNTLYVSSLGNYSDQGGIDQVDATTYAVTNLFSGTPVQSVAIVNSTTGYYVNYISWGNTKVYPFNPSTMVVGTELSGVGNNQSALKVDPDSRLWIADGTTGHSGIYLIDTSDNSIISGPVSTNLVPKDIDFAN